MIWSSLSQLFVVLMIFVGFGLYAYYHNQARADTDALSLSVFPIFIATVMPAGLKGLMIVGLAAAALSSLNAALSGLAETTVHSLWWRERVTDERGPCGLRQSGERGSDVRRAADASARDHERAGR